MERLTLLLGKLDKEVCGSKGLYSCYYNRLHNCCEVIDSIQEELGIPLEVLFKALKEGVYVRLKKENDIDFIEQLSMDNVMEDPCFYYCNTDTITIGGFINPQYTELYFKDYGKTWALTREELENVKD